MRRAASRFLRLEAAIKSLLFMPSSIQQLAFDLRIPSGRSLVPLEAVMVLADRDEDAVLALIDNGQLRWAYNIASPGSERREIRILRSSVLSYLDRSSDPVESADDALTSILPKPMNVRGHETIRAVEVERRFCCSQGLVAKLIHAGCFTLAGPVAGPKVSPYILHTSVAQFLRTRSL